MTVSTSPTSNISLYSVFSFLTPKDSISASLVCKEWNRQYQSLASRCTVIDKTVWEAHVDLEAMGLSFDDMEEITENQISKNLSQFFADLKREGRAIKAYAGVTVFTLPRGLNFETLWKIARKAQIDPTPLQSRIPEKLQYLTVRKTYQSIIANHLVISSNGEPVAVEKNDERPTKLQTTALAIMSALTSPEKNPPAWLMHDDDLWASLSDENSEFEANYAPPDALTARNLFMGFFAV